MKSLDEFGSVLAMAALVLGACAAVGAEAATQSGNSREASAGSIVSNTPQANPQSVPDSWQKR